MTRALSSAPRAQTGPVITATAVARALGWSTWEVHALEPYGMGSPRDRRWNGREYVYTGHGVELLVAELRARGEADRANSLENAWAERVQPDRRKNWYRAGQYA